MLDTEPGRSPDIEALEERSLFSTFTVTNTNNSGAGSLRRAIDNANAHSGSDKILFNIPGAGVHVISPNSQLPQITDTVTVDGYSQPGTSKNTKTKGNNAKLKIELLGKSLPTGAIGLRIAPNANACVVRGLIIGGWKQSGFGGHAILSAGPNAVITGNYIGVNATGTKALQNDFGLDVSGAGTRIGGTSPADANLISGNRASGVNVFLDAGPGALVEGNLIGTDASGAHATPNGDGVAIIGGQVTVGGLTGGARNVISGNSVAGVFLANGGAQALVEGNFIGTDVNGTKALGNKIGVQLQQTSNAVVGGSKSAARNIISGNGTGVDVSISHNNFIIGNYIGTDVTGSNPLGNTGDGVLIHTMAGAAATSKSNIVGGSSDTANRLAYNGGSGVGVTASGPVGPNTLNSIRHNQIFSNTGLGIDLGDDGVTPNDPNDSDGGPNHLQNFPVITSAVVSNGQLTIKGTLSSSIGTIFNIDFYSSDDKPASGHANAKTFVGTVMVTSNASGLAIFHHTFALPSGAKYITATATTIGAKGSGDTSEFAAPVKVS